jgi:hypothetical protein
MSCIRVDGTTPVGSEGEGHLQLIDPLSPAKTVLQGQDSLVCVWANHSLLNRSPIAELNLPSLP